MTNLGVGFTSPLHGCDARADLFERYPVLVTTNGMLIGWVMLGVKELMRENLRGSKRVKILAVVGKFE